MQLGGTANDRRSAHDVAFGYQPALDGVRAIAIVLVILFHLGYSWMPGGYLGVSVFFTLSGFLITSLLLDERSRRNAIRVRSFYARRVRRLLPASLVCIAGVSVLVVRGCARSRHGRGIVASLLQVANWQQLLAHQSYADLFRAPSAVAHFWSLAIEEQFYWVWPIAIAGITERAARRGRQSVLAPIVAAYLAFSASALLTARYLSADAVYFASWSRFAEILAGAALAAALTRRTVSQRGSVAGSRVRHRDHRALGAHADRRWLGLCRRSSVVRAADRRAHRRAPAAERDAAAHCRSHRSSGSGASATSSTCSTGPSSCC